jgi:hypothetical protein
MNKLIPSGKQQRETCSGKYEKGPIPTEKTNSADAAVLVDGSSIIQ